MLSSGNMGKLIAMPDVSRGAVRSRWSLELGRLPLAVTPAVVDPTGMKGQIHGCGPRFAYNGTNPRLTSRRVRKKFPTR